jgi:hypothetical protein
LPEIAAQGVSYVPDEVGQVLLVQRCSSQCVRAPTTTSVGQTAREGVKRGNPAGERSSLCRKALKRRVAIWRFNRR